MCGGRTRDLAPCAAWDALRAEAGGLLAGDQERLRDAASLFLSCEMPYEAARCLLDAGKHQEARDLIERHGFAGGPLGARLAAA